MRRLSLASPLALSLLALPVAAETLSQELARTGLAAVESRLAALPAPSDAERFTLGGVQFLRAVEISFQLRYAQGLTDRTGMIPFLRLPIPDNPTPQNFTPDTIARIFAQAHDQLAAAQATLSAIPESSDFVAEIDAADLWFDVNANAVRDPGEALAEVLASTLGIGAEGAGAPGRLPIRFDVADAAWAAAYADLLAALCDVVLAYDPTEPITRILSARAQMQALAPIAPDYILGLAGGVDPVDLAAIVLAALNQQPDRPRMAEARLHLLRMVDENRAFWARVALETDDDAEWLPRPGQHAATGIELPPDAPAAWAAVLDQMQAVLNGDRLIPWWRLESPAGVNLARVFTDPRPVDLAGWVQGWAALPYLQTGPLASTDTLAAFDAVVQGDSMLFAIWFN